MAEVKWQARRISDGVLVDVTGDTEGTPLTAPTPNALEAGGSSTLEDVLIAGRDTGGIDNGALTPVISSTEADASGIHDASVSVKAIATSLSDAYADRTATSVGGDAYARTIVTTTGGEDAIATTATTTATGEADASVAATVTGALGGNAFANSTAASAGLNAEAKNSATTDATGDANASSTATANGNGDAVVSHEAAAFGTGLAQANLWAVSNAGQAGVTVEANNASVRMAFFDATPVTKRPANADTSGATLAALETEVNEIKALLRAYGLLAT